MTTLQAVEKLLAELGDVISDSPEAAALRGVATALDDTRTSPNARALLTKSLNDTIARLRALQPAEAEEDPVSALRQRAQLKLVRPA